MKKTIKFLVAIILISGIISCDDLTDVHFNTTITERIPVHIDQTGGASVSFDETIALNLDNSDTHDYLQDIKNIEITSLSYKIIDFYGDNNGTITVQFFIDSNPLLNQSITVKTSADNDTVFEITDIQDLNTIATALQNNHQVTARYQGNARCDDDTMDFRVEIIMVLAITASPI